MTTLKKTIFDSSAPPPLILFFSLFSGFTRNSISENCRMSPLLTDVINVILAPRVKKFCKKTLGLKRRE